MYVVPSSRRRSRITRPTTERSFTGVSGVRCDKRRKAVYVVAGARGMPSGAKRIQTKPSEWND
eukprot:8292153-Pyramimonas_sp.AAC.1